MRLVLFLVAVVAVAAIDLHNKEEGDLSSNNVFQKDAAEVGQKTQEKLKEAESKVLELIRKLSDSLSGPSKDQVQQLRADAEKLDEQRKKLQEDLKQCKRRKGKYKIAEKPSQKVAELKKKASLLEIGGTDEFISTGDIQQTVDKAKVQVEQAKEQAEQKVASIQKTVEKEKEIVKSLKDQVDEQKAKLKTVKEEAEKLVAAAKESHGKLKDAVGKLLEAVNKLLDGVPEEHKKLARQLKKEIKKLKRQVKKLGRRLKRCAKKVARKNIKRQKRTIKMLNREEKRENRKVKGAIQQEKEAKKDEKLKESEAQNVGKALVKEEQKVLQTKIEANTVKVALSQEKAIVAANEQAAADAAFAANAAKKEGNQAMSAAGSIPLAPVSANPVKPNMFTPLLPGQENTRKKDEEVGLYLPVFVPDDGMDRVREKTDRAGVTPNLAFNPKVLHSAKLVDIRTRYSHSDFVRAHEKNCQGSFCGGDQ